MPLRAIARMIQTMLYAQRFFPYYVNNILGGIEEDGARAPSFPTFILLTNVLSRLGSSVLLRPRRVVRARGVSRSRRRVVACSAILGQPGKLRLLLPTPFRRITVLRRARREPASLSLSCILSWSDAYPTNVRPSRSAYYMTSYPGSAYMCRCRYISRIKLPFRECHIRRTCHSPKSSPSSSIRSQARRNATLRYSSQRFAVFYVGNMSLTCIFFSFPSYFSVLRMM